MGGLVYKSKNELKVINKDFRNYYKRNVKPKDRLHEYDNDRVISLFLKKVSEYLINYRAGVFIDRIGYFYVYKHPLQLGNAYMQRRLNDYHLTFMPTVGSPFRYWSIDHHFNKTLQKKFREKLKKGYRYLNMIDGLGVKTYYYDGLYNRHRRLLKKNKKNEI